MPKVTDAHREQRRQQILTAAWDLFGHNGFHATSMSEIIAASGLSAGAVYLYFRSKEELIVAIARTALGTARAVSAELLQAPAAVAPGEAVVRIIGGLQSLQRRAGGVMYAVAIQAWAEAVRNPTIASTARGFFTDLLIDLGAILDRWVADGHPLAGSTEDLARMMAGSLQGYVIQLASFGVVPDDGYLTVLGERITAMVSTPETASPKRADSAGHHRATTGT